MKTCKRDGREYPSRPLTGQMTVNALPIPRICDMRFDSSLNQRPLVRRAPLLPPLRIMARTTWHDRIDLACVMRSTSKTDMSSRIRAYAPCRFKPREWTSSANASCPSKCTQPSGDIRGTLTACLPRPVLITLIACVDEFGIGMRYLEERKGVLVNALGYYLSTEMEVVELFNCCGLDMTRV